jgi:hypothetical protein
LDKTSVPRGAGIRGSSFFSERSRIIAGVHSPLGFFLLALLVVEAFLFGAGVFFDLSPTVRVVELAVGVILFLVVIGLVYNLVVKYPKNLVFSESSHVEFAAMQMWGHSANPITGDTLDSLAPVQAPAPPSPQPAELPGPQPPPPAKES